MNVPYIYICRVSDFQASGNQIDIPKSIAIDFFNAPIDSINNGRNVGVNICHSSDLTTFEIIELQPATNLRWSTRLNSFLARNDDPLTNNCLLVFEKLVRSYCVHTIKDTDSKYQALTDLFEEEEKHMLLSASLIEQPKNPSEITPQLRPYITAIKSKPFLLLAGISGTGKSRIVRELARACWDEGSEEYKATKPRNFEMVQVKPNWHDSSELIGYVSRVSGEAEFIAGDFLRFVVRAWDEEDVPYFLCLDEMNLAPVEQYFAEYLSVIETRKNKEGTIVTDPILKPALEKNELGELQPKKWYAELIKDLLSDCSPEKEFGLKTQFETEGIALPKNLIVVGTVNMDETTFSFSRKVLDRAMTIEMNEVKLDGGLTERNEKIGKLGNTELIGTAVEGVDVYSSYQGVCDEVIHYLEEINDKLENTPFKIAYRTRNEALLYVVNNLPYNKDEDGKDLDEKCVVARALDEITSMKILSRIEGDETKIGSLLDTLKTAISVQLKEVSGKDYSPKKDETEKVYSPSLAKLEEMISRLESGYTSFWS